MRSEACASGDRSHVGRRRSIRAARCGSSRWRQLRISTWNVTGGGRSRQMIGDSADSVTNCDPGIAVRRYSTPELGWQKSASTRRVWRIASGPIQRTASVALPRSVHDRTGASSRSGWERRSRCARGPRGRGHRPQRDHCCRARRCPADHSGCRMRTRDIPARLLALSPAARSPARALDQRQLGVQARFSSSAAASSMRAAAMRSAQPPAGPAVAALSYRGAPLRGWLRAGPHAGARHRGSPVAFHVGFGPRASRPGFLRVLRDVRG